MPIDHGVEDLASIMEVVTGGDTGRSLKLILLKRHRDKLADGFFSHLSELLDALITENDPRGGYGENTTK